MKNILIMCMTMTAVAFTAPAIANEEVSSESTSKVTVEKEADGSYKEKRAISSESTDASGTTNKTETKVTAETDSSGNVEKSVKTKIVADPKGPLNKSKTVIADSVKHKDGKTKIKHSKKVDGTTVEETIEEKDSVN